MRAPILVAVLALLAPLGPSLSYAQGETVSEKSTAIEAQIEAAKRRLLEVATEGTPPVRLDDAPILEDVPPLVTPDGATRPTPAMDAEAGRRLALAIALNRPPSDRELSAYLRSHGNPSADEAASWTTFPGRWNALGDPVKRMEGYEEHGSRVYCALANVMGREALAGAFSLDPVVAARCRDGVALVLRESGLKAAFDDIAFVAQTTGTSELSNADATSLREQLPAYFEDDGKAEAVENWARAASRHVRLRLQWAALGQTETGRGRQRTVIEAVRAGDEAPIQRADVFRSRTWRQYALADFNDSMNELHGIGTRSLEGSLSTHCVFAGATTCY